MVLSDMHLSGVHCNLVFAIQKQKEQQPVLVPGEQGYIEGCHLLSQTPVNELSSVSLAEA